jgi:hypothetical protein
MIDALRYAGQVVFYAAICAFIGYFASRPVSEHFPKDRAQIKMSFMHGAARRESCRQLSYEEISKLPPSQRRPNDCKRERVPMKLKLLIDDKVVFDAELQPTGLSHDGPAKVYRKFAVAAGRHTVSANLNDSGRADGFDYVKTQVVELSPRQNFVVDFKPDMGGFIFQ